MAPCHFCLHVFPICAVPGFRVWLRNEKLTPPVTYMPYILFVFAILLLSFPALAQKPNGKDQLAPHKALYEIELVSTSSGSQIVNVQGQMMYEWHPSCEAWNTKHRFNLIYDYADNPPLRITSDFSTFEPFDGESFSFTSMRKRDGDLFEEIRGSATISKNGEGEAIYSLPEDLQYDLPVGTVFPINHSLNVLEAIKAGQKFYSATIFDGSNEDGPVDVNTFIGGKANALAHVTPSENLDMELINRPAWNVQLAFFPIIASNPVPDYEMDVKIHDNGVISHMIVSYEDFTISQNLIALEALESSCE